MILQLFTITTSFISFILPLPLQTFINSELNFFYSIITIQICHTYLPRILTITIISNISSIINFLNHFLNHFLKFRQSPLEKCSTRYYQQYGWSIHIILCLHFHAMSCVHIFETQEYPNFILDSPLLLTYNNSFYHVLLLHTFLCLTYWHPFHTKSTSLILTIFYIIVNFCYFRVILF